MFYSSGARMEKLSRDYQCISQVFHNRILFHVSAKKDSVVKLCTKVSLKVWTGVQVKSDGKNNLCKRP